MQCSDMESFASYESGVESDMTSLAVPNLHPISKSFKIPKLNKNITAPDTLGNRSAKPVQSSISFQSLKMKSLDGYLIPDEIAEIELENNTNHLSKLEDMIKDSKENEDTYYKLAASMIHLEELSSSMSAQSLNAERVCLKLLCYQKNLFEMKLEVSMN